MDERRVKEILRLIALLQAVQGSSANPFDIDIVEKVKTLRSYLPELKLLDELLLDSEALLELARIVKLQDQWLKHRASSLYIDPLLVQLKIKIISKENLADAFVKSWHPIAQIDQITPSAIEKAFIYWRDLRPISERFKIDLGQYGVKLGQISYDKLVELGILTMERFDKLLSDLEKELAQRSKGKWIDYRGFIKSSEYEKEVLRAYLLSFLVSEGKALLRIDPLSENIWIKSLAEKAEGEARSVAISLAGGD